MADATRPGMADATRPGMVDATKPGEQAAAEAGDGITPVLEALEWRCIGPHRGGRVVAVAGDPHQPMTFYFGACAGGVWKTTDGGTYWENISDGYFTTAAVGAIAVSAADPNVIYAGTGETTIRGNVSHGDGVYKSTDGGKTWVNVGLRDTRHIAKIRIHPQNPDHVYVAALGHAFGPNAERGVFRSTDGGASWDKILYRDENTGACDLDLDPHNPRILYAALWQTRRYPWKLDSGGPGCGLFRSTDGGDTWTEITRNPGLPRGVLGKIGVAVSPAQPGRVWALIEANDGALFRSDDGGASWRRLCADPKLRRRAWYYMHLYADPQDAETCWVLNLDCWRSVDGGKTFDAVPTPHGDNHDLWIDPANPRRLIEGNDGGACVSFNGGASWSTLYNQPTAQFYHVTTDTGLPYRVYGSQQDNTALSLPSRSFEGAIGASEWFIPGGGESGYIAVRPDNPTIAYGGAIGSGFGNGLLWRHDHATRANRNITVWPDVTGMGEGADALKYRFQWTFPVELSPHDPGVLYVAANRLFRSTDEGASWEALSPDLTRDDKSKQASSGGPITQDNTGAEAYNTIFAFCESPHQRGLFWAGTDDGLVHLSRDGGQTWQNITPPELPEWALVSMIELSPHDPATAYLAATCYKLDDTRPYLFKTSDYGASWQSITGGIPATEFTRAIRVDPAQPGLLYAGTETGLYVSFDDGAQWRRMGGTLPVTPVYDMVRKDDDLVVATHGRSFWILDDVALLHRLAAGERVAEEPRLFAPAPATRYASFTWPEEEAAGVNYDRAGPLAYGLRRTRRPDGSVATTLLDAGENPPSGVAVRYWLPGRPDGEITLSFLDEAGAEIRSFTSKKDPRPPAADAEAQVTDEAEVTARDEAGTAAGAGEGAALALGVEGREGEPAAVAPEEEATPEGQTWAPKEAGLNRFIWDMRGPEALKVTGDTSMGFFLGGPIVLPGRYQVRLSVGEQTWTQPFELVSDPRAHVTREGEQAQYDLVTAINRKISEASGAVNQIRDLTAQLAGWSKRLKAGPGGENVGNADAGSAGNTDAGSAGNAEIVAAVEALKAALTAIEEALFKTEPDTNLHYTARLSLSARLAGLKFAVALEEYAPTRQAVEVYEDLAGKVDAHLERLRALLDTDLARLNAQLRAAEIPFIAPAPAQPASA